MSSILYEAHANYAQLSRDFSRASDEALLALNERLINYRQAECLQIPGRYLIPHIPTYKHPIGRIEEPDWTNTPIEFTMRLAEESGNRILSLNMGQIDDFGNVTDRHIILKTGAHPNLPPDVVTSVIDERSVRPLPEGNQPFVRLRSVSSLPGFTTHEVLVTNNDYRRERKIFRHHEGITTTDYRLGKHDRPASDVEARLYRRTELLGYPDETIGRFIGLQI